MQKLSVRPKKNVGRVRPLGSLVFFCQRAFPLKVALRYGTEQRRSERRQRPEVIRPTVKQINSLRRVFQLTTK